MARGVRIIDRDRGFKALVRRVKGARNRAITVGVHSGEGGAPAAGGGTVADVASINEFGLGNVPERSFVRAWADENKSENADLLRKIGESIVRGSGTVEDGLERAGLVMAASMQKRIAGGIGPENAPSTIAKKGSSTPLVDEGILKASITHKVE